MSIRPIPVPTKVHSKILHLLVVTFDMRCLRRFIHMYVLDGSGLLNVCEYFLGTEKTYVYRLLLENAY